MRLRLNRVHRQYASRAWWLLLGPMLAACGSDNPQEAAQKALQQGNIQLAADLARSDLQAHPNDAARRAKLAGLLLELGDAAGAGVEFDKARQAGASAELFAPGMARVMVEQHQYQKALDTYASTKLQDPAASAELDTWLATALLRLGKQDAAMAKIKETLALRPGHPRATALAARLTGNTGDLDQAFKLLDTAMAQPDGDKQPELWMARADLQLYGKRDAAAASDAYTKVLALQPSNALAHSNLIHLLLIKPDLSAASTALAAMSKALPKHPQTLFAAALVAVQKKDFARARDLLQPLLRAGSNNVEVMALAGGVDLELGNVASAVSQLQRAVFQAPTATSPRKALARAYLRQGASDQALETLAPLLQAKSADRDTLSLAASAHLAAGRAREAEALYARALALAPEDARTKTQLALAKMRNSPAEALALLQSTADSSKDTVADMALISAQMERKDFAGAVQSIEKLKVKEPQSAQPMMLLGQVALIKRDLAGARLQFEAAASKDPKFVPAVLMLASLDQADGKHAQAETRLTEFLKKEPRATRASLALAEVQERRSLPQATVLKTFSDAVAANPTDATARKALMAYHLRRNEAKALLEAAQAANAALPGDLAILSMLGNAQMMAGDVNQALATFQKLIKQAPDNPKGYIQLAQAETVAGRTTQAERSYRKALELDADSVDANRGLVSLGLKDKRPDMALKAAKAIQKDRPDDGLGHVLEGDILLRQGKNDAALAAYRAGLDRKRPTPLASRVFAVLSMAKDGEPAAQQFANEWLKKHPQDLSFRFFLGNVAMEAARWPQAEEQFSEVVKLAPKLPTALNNLAWVKLKQGKPGAVTLAEQALAQAPDFPVLLDTLALAQVAEGQAAKAVDTAKLAVSKAPDVAGYHITLAQALLKTGNKQAASTALSDAEKLKPNPGQVKEIAELRKQAG